MSKEYDLRNISEHNYIFKISIERCNQNSSDKDEMPDCIWASIITKENLNLKEISTQASLGKIALVRYWQKWSGLADWRTVIESQL